MRKKIFEILIPVLIIILLVSVAAAESRWECGYCHKIIPLELGKKICPYCGKHTHQWTPATCTEPESCECGETRGEPLGHNWVQPDSGDAGPRICSVCGATEEKALNQSQEKSLDLSVSPGNSAGTIKVELSGGTAPYTILYSCDLTGSVDPESVSTADSSYMLTELLPGTVYQITVQDSTTYKSVSAISGAAPAFSSVQGSNPVLGYELRMYDRNYYLKEASLIKNESLYKCIRSASSPAKEISLDRIQPLGKNDFCLVLQTLLTDSERNSLIGKPYTVILHVDQAASFSSAGVIGDMECCFGIDSFKDLLFFSLNGTLSQVVNRPETTGTAPCIIDFLIESKQLYSIYSVITTGK